MAELHPQIISFFISRLSEHNCVESWERVPHKTEILYKVTRKHGLRPVIVHLSDAYLYTQAEFAARPVGIGDFILVARPEASIDPAAIELGNKMDVPIGKIGKLMGALNVKHIWEYRSPNERQPSPEMIISVALGSRQKKHRS